MSNEHAIRKIEAEANAISESLREIAQKLITLTSRLNSLNDAIEQVSAKIGARNE